jgi:uncharacterized membrane protein YfcA
MILILIGITVGLLLGLTGAGGSVVAVPLLMAGLGLSLPDAAPLALVAVLTASTWGTLSAWRAGLVRYRAAAVMALAAMAVAPAGLAVAHALPHRVLVGVFALVLGWVAARMFLQSVKAPDETAVVRAHVTGPETSDGIACRLNPDTGRLVWTRACFWVMAAAGGVMGFLSSLLGVGGGFVAVPALRRVTDIPIHAAVATSLMTISVSSIATLMLLVARGSAPPVLQVVPFAAGALAGMVMGRWLAPRIAGPRLQQGFALLLAAVAINMAVGG